MNLLLWLVGLILVLSVNSSPGPDARRYRQTSRSSRNNRRELSDQELMKALSILLSENDQGDEESEVAKLRDREGRQGDGFVNPNGNCEVTGFETRVRNECEEVTEVECTPVNVTKTRSEIVNRCKTEIDKICDLTFNDVPTQKCSPKQTNR